MKKLAWIILLASSFAVSATLFSPTVQASELRQKFKNPFGNAQQSGRVDTLAQPLTSGECTALGGETKETLPSVCGSGKYCTRTGADGKSHRVCISKTDAATKNAPAADTPKKPKRPGGSKAQAPAGGVVVAIPLTEAECTGLGGVTTVNTATCHAAGQKTCTTTDANGVIRTACINKAAQ